MRKKLIVLCALVFMIGCSPDKKGNELVSFKGGTLTTEDIEAHYKKLQKDKQFKNNPEMLTKKFVFEHALNMEMIIAEGLNNNLHLNPDIRLEIHGFMSDLFLRIMQDNLVPAIDRNSITEEQVKKFYDENPELYTTKSLYDVSLIKITDKSMAETVRNDILTNTISFEDAAQKYSEDKESAVNHGKTGIRSLDKFRPEWQKAIKNLELNNLSMPENLNNSWYLFMLTNKTEPEKQSFDEKKEYIRNDVLYARYRDEWNKTYAELRKKFEVKINQTVMDTFTCE